MRSSVATYHVHINWEHYLQNIPQPTANDGILKRRATALNAFKSDVETWQNGRCAENGVAIDHVLFEGILNVRCSADTAEALRTLPGVSRVSCS